MTDRARRKADRWTNKQIVGGGGWTSKKKVGDREIKREGKEGDNEKEE